MRKRILVPVADDFETLRKRSLVNGVGYWAERRDLQVDIKSISEIKRDGIDSPGTAFCYKALTTLGNRKLLILPPSLPVVIDVAVPVKGVEDLFTGRRLAIRNAFGTSTSAWKPEQQVPMLPPPLWDDGTVVRDTVIFDVKSFHDVETHLYVASMLAGIANFLEKIEEKLKLRLKFYFTSFFNYGLYEQLLKQIAADKSLECAGKVVWNKIKDRITPPAHQHEQYLEILKSTRLLITEHGDIVDSDVTHALCCGTPTLTYKRMTFARSTGFQCSALQGIALLDPYIRMKLEFANAVRVKEEWGVINALSIGKVPKWDVGEYESLFMASWDKLYDWAVHGTVDGPMNAAMAKGGWNKGISLDNVDHFRAASIIRLSERSGK